jgi:hypothetical protein
MRRLKVSILNQDLLDRSNKGMSDKRGIEHACGDEHFRRNLNQLM